MKKSAPVFLIIFLIVITGCTSTSPSESGSLMDEFLRGKTDDDTIRTQPSVEPGQISGRVRDLNTMEPVGGASVKLENHVTTYTDNDGYFEIKNIYIDSPEEEQGVFSGDIHVEYSSYETLSEPISVFQGQETEVDLRLRRQTALVSGHVILNNTYVNGAEIHLGSNSVLSNSLGYFSVENVPLGMNTLKVYINNELRLSTMREIEEDYNNLNINLNDYSGDFVETGTVQGNVKDETNGQILSGMITSISGFPAVLSGTKESGSGENSSIKGFYSLKNIPVGERTLTVIDPDGNYYDYTENINVETGINYLDVEMTPKPSAVSRLSNIVGIVTDEEGNLLENIRISLRVFDGEETYELDSDISKGDGWYSFSNIPQDRYIITAVDRRDPKVYMDYYDENIQLEDGTIYKIISIPQL
ncbi:MAG: carboxypeptidase-like regulatory domain-containing protein [Candidatus Muiribacteriota bacterium]